MIFGDKTNYPDIHEGGNVLQLLPSLDNAPLHHHRAHAHHAHGRPLDGPCPYFFCVSLPPLLHMLLNTHPSPMQTIRNELKMNTIDCTI